jgi:hypothetical protein
MTIELKEESQPSRVEMLTLSCVDPNCNIKFRIGRFINIPILSEARLRFCPTCGATARIEYDSNEDYLETLAANYGISVEIFVEVYNIWNPKEQPNFREFFDSIKKEAAQIK